MLIDKTVKIRIIFKCTNKCGIKCCIYLYKTVTITRHLQVKMKQIILIRHGEKTLSDPIHLSHVGKIRASGLVSYFSDSSGEFRVPKSIYAMRPSESDKSQRCIETTKPLVKHLQASFCTSFGKMEIDRLVDAILADPSDTILVCWEHRMIPAIANLLGYPMEYWGFTPLTNPTHECFNATWVLKGRSMKVYSQFDIVHENIVYTHPRNIPLFTWNKSFFCCM